jgi:hypothetical protein
MTQGQQLAGRREARRRRVRPLAASAAAGSQEEGTVTEQVTGVRWVMVPHHGPARTQCPGQNLLTVLPMSSLGSLTWAWPPLAVSGVVEPQTDGRLSRVQGTGRRRLTEIEAALACVGLPLGCAPQDPAGAEGLPC